MFSFVLQDSKFTYTLRTETDTVADCDGNKLFDQKLTGGTSISTSKIVDFCPGPGSTCTGVDGSKSCNGNPMAKLGGYATKTSTAGRSGPAVKQLLVDYAGNGPHLPWHTSHMEYDDSQGFEDCQVHDTSGPFQIETGNQAGKKMGRYTVEIKIEPHRKLAAVSGLDQEYKSTTHKLHYNFCEDYGGYPAASLELVRDNSMPYALTAGLSPLKQSMHLWGEACFTG